jgi:hypothetical protein
VERVRRSARKATLSTLATRTLARLVIGKPGIRIDGVLVSLFA